MDGGDQDTCGGEGQPQTGQDVAVLNGQGSVAPFTPEQVEAPRGYADASPAVRADIAHFFEDLVPEDPARYAHGDEGPDDMPAHLRAMLTGTTMGLPVLDARPVLGTWQGLYLFEHRRAPHRREVVLHLIGD